MSQLVHLIDRNPSLDSAAILTNLVPPPQFSEASFSNYIPNPDFPSQQLACDVLKEFVSLTSGTLKPGKLFSRAKKSEDVLPGVYLDGGFGVGKTHLLAATWNAASGRKYFGTFLQYTSLVGALGYAKAVEALKGSRLICIDEFELDDPGDTMMMTRMLGELVATGTKIAATSNTPPAALGEGRFAAADFLREIQALASFFTTIRIDGTDYRQRAIEGVAQTLSDSDLAQRAEALNNQGLSVSMDSFDQVLQHLSTVHPSVYVQLISGIQSICVSDVHVLNNQTDALRFVAFIDRVYDAQIPLFASGVPLSEIFGGDMIHGGYRKKYLRCVSRLIALTHSTP
jgi:cell division protein ZapE